MIKNRDTQGFTLVELMVVVAIIGVLAAIAILQFDAYRKKGYESGAVWDVKNAAAAQEAYYVDYQTYATSRNLLDGYGLSSTEGVTLTIACNKDAYTLVSYHAKGGKTYTLTGPGGSLTSN